MKFRVENIFTEEVFEVYAVDGTYFMLWDEHDKCWFFGNIQNYRPHKEVDNGET